MDKRTKLGGQLIIPYFNNVVVSLKLFLGFKDIVYGALEAEPNKAAKYELAAVINYSFQTKLARLTKGNASATWFKTTALAPHCISAW